MPTVDFEVDVLEGAFGVEPVDVAEGVIAGGAHLSIDAFFGEVDAAFGV